MKTKRFVSEQGSSLIEMLSTVAIICILASLLIGGIHASRQKAKAGMCMSNLKNLTDAMLMQTYDSEKFPTAIAYREAPLEDSGSSSMAFAATSDYYNNNFAITKCPNVSGSMNDTNPVYSYGINELISGVNLARIQNPSQIIVVAESANKPFVNDAGDIAYRHGNIAYAGFADGHVGRVSNRDLETAFENYLGSVPPTEPEIVVPPSVDPVITTPPPTVAPVVSTQPSNQGGNGYGVLYNGNNGVGNGLDPTPGNSNSNDGAGTGTGDPGHKGGKKK